MDGQNEQVPISSVFRYMFQHMDDFNVCYKFCNEIIDIAFRQTHSQKKIAFSNAALYDDIINSDLKLLHPVFLNEISINEEHLKYIGTDHRSNFSESSWDKIKVFEWQFQTYCNLKEKLSYENMLDKKYEFLKLCKTTNENSRDIRKMIAKCIEKTKARKAAADALNGIHINTGIQHLPNKIETEIKELSRHTSRTRQFIPFCV